MKNMTVKAVIAIVFVVAIAVGTIVVREWGGMDKEVVLPDDSMETLPMAFGDWTGKETELDDRLFRKIGADEVVNRLYTNKTGKAVTFHGAVIGTFVRNIPHHPTVCYGVAGWTLIKQKEVEIKIPGEEPIKASTIIYDMNGRRLMVMFWYLFGDLAVHDNMGMAEALREYRDADHWPSTIKFLLQTELTTPEQSEETLLRFARELYAITKGAQDHGFGGGTVAEVKSESVDSKKPEAKPAVAATESAKE